MTTEPREPLSPLDTLAMRLYRRWCDAQNASPRGWTGPDALPEHRKEPWRAVAALATALATALIDAPEKRPVPARVVKAVAPAPVLSAPLLERWHARSAAERREPETA